jgi:hypothetical protein
VISLAALEAALARLPPELGRAAGPLAVANEPLEAFLEDLARDRLFIPGPYPELGVDLRVPAPPRDRLYRRHVLLAAGVVGDPAVAPAVRLALAAAGPRAPHAFRRIGIVAEALAAVVDPLAPLTDPVRGEDLCRRIAAAFLLGIEGETAVASAERLAAIDVRNAERSAREAAAAEREAEIARAIAAAADRPAPLKLLPD